MSYNVFLYLNSSKFLIEKCVNLKFNLESKIYVLKMGFWLKDIRRPYYSKYIITLIIFQHIFLTNFYWIYWYCFGNFHFINIKNKHLVFWLIGILLIQHSNKTKWLINIAKLFEIDSYIWLFLSQLVFVKFFEIYFFKLCILTHHLNLLVFHH